MSMSKFLTIGAGVALMGAVATHFFMGVSAHNYAVGMEVQIKTQYDSNRNTLSNTALKIKEMFSVRDEHYKGLEKIIKNTMTGRYGKDGSKAVFQYLKENNLKPDTKLDLNVQNVISSGRSEFKASQDALLTLKGSYEKELSSYFYGGYIRNAGFPKIDLNRYDIIVSQETQNKFDSKTDNVISLR